MKIIMKMTDTTTKTGRTNYKTWLTVNFWWISLILGTGSLFLDSNKWIFPREDVNLIAVSIFFYALGSGRLFLNIRKYVEDVVQQQEVHFEKQMKAQNKLLADQHRNIVNKIKIVATKERFYRMNAVNALDYISSNIHNYSQIYNIKIRPVQNESDNLGKAIERWRDKVDETVESHLDKNLTIVEIVANLPEFIRKGQELVDKCKENHLMHKNYRVQYRCHHLEEGPTTIQVRNFMILHRENGLEGEAVIREMYWGWPDKEIDGDKMRVYYTTNEAMIDDYYNRYKLIRDNCSTGIEPTEKKK